MYAAREGDDGLALRRRIETARKRVNANPAVLERHDSINKHLPPPVRKRLTV